MRGAKVQLRKSVTSSSADADGADIFAGATTGGKGTDSVSIVEFPLTLRTGVLSADGIAMAWVFAKRPCGRRYDRAEAGRFKREPPLVWEELLVRGDGSKEGGGCARRSLNGRAARGATASSARDDAFWSRGCEEVVTGLGILEV